MSDFPRTLVETVRYFSDEAVCRDFLAAVRWPEGVECPFPGCGSKDVVLRTGRSVWRCKICRWEFSVKGGTIFEDSPIPLSKWLPALWMILAFKKGVSSYQLARNLGVTQKTAWFMGHRIRLAMAESFGPLFGEIEADETYVGGKAKFQHESKRKHIGTGGIGKAAVMGLLNRHGKDGHSTVQARTVPNVRRKSLHHEVRGHVVPGSTIYTDALKSYNGLEQDFIHQVIDHAEKYVEGRVHTNGLENFWSLFKRMVYGTHHSVTPVHLDRYLDEATFRFNTRERRDVARRFGVSKLKDWDRFMTVAHMLIGRRLTYKELTGKVGLSPALA